MLGRFGNLVPLVAQNAPIQQQQRGMATLKSISMRLKSVKNIQKITQSMKMVSAAKYARAERELKQTRPIGAGAGQFYEKAEVAAPEDTPQKLMIAMTSDRGNWIRYPLIDREELLECLSFIKTVLNVCHSSLHFR